MERLDRAAKWTGWPLDDERRQQLVRLGGWLTDEAIPAGGLGPNEGDRIEKRHLADSILFGRGWEPPRPPRTLVDLGSGVGLPGLPLAILWPETAVTLVDRSRNRVDLARRATRILGLGNVEVLQHDAGTMTGRYEMVVARAAGSPDRVRKWGMRLIAPGGTVVLGGSHRERPQAEAGESVLEVEPGILDRAVWLRMITGS